VVFVPVIYNTNICHFKYKNTKQIYHHSLLLYTEDRGVVNVTLEQAALLGVQVVSVALLVDDVTEVD